MCPFSAMVQFLIVVVITLLICHGVFAKINCEPKKIPHLQMYDTSTINCNVTDMKENEFIIRAETENSYIASTSKETILLLDENFYLASFNVTGNFLGKTIVSVNYQEKNRTLEYVKIPVIVVRRKRVIDTVFTASVALLVSIIYINFGCALKWSELKTNLKRPIGPIIGCIGQFLVMPILSFVIGKVLFPNNPAMQLGMFFTGVSPGGGASNMWTVILGGNVDLSITMTTISTFAAFGTMPFWLFTLGKMIFEADDIPVPYKEISTYAVALVIPLFIGYLIQRYLKRVGILFARMLKCCSAILMIFIITFAIVTNLYLFKLFSWEIIVAGLCLPWLGYLMAWLIAKVLKQPPADCLAIAVETGIQNTGISIFLLRITLPQPTADLTTVVPVAVAIMTPFPLLFLYILQKIKQSCHNKRNLIIKNSENDYNQTNIITYS